jgi:hypothetical protein
MRIATVPRTPSRTRTTASEPGGMKSTSRTAPSLVSNSVSRTSVPGRSRRLIRRTRPTGAIRQRPWRSSPSSAAQQAPASNRGRHSQSIEPSRLTSAAVRRLPMRP